ncbi:hypothetical protein WJR50_02370 [Catalinimonas sp. 4WD22]|uniref:hypothetical protein n=1 Tax=Catalinimonas locisalis TaxID=3133978 RepID=UPI0031016EE1
MGKKAKIISLIFGMSLLSVFLFIVMGLYLMEIEDHYGDQQDFYFQSEEGDIFINRDTKAFKKVEKTWKRLYGIQHSDTTDLWAWLKENNIEVYRPLDSNFDQYNLSYEELNKLIEEGKLELVIKK